MRLSPLRSEWMTWFFIFVVLISSFIFIVHHPAIADEKDVYQTASYFVQSELNPKIFLNSKMWFTSTFPTYGMLLGFLSSFFGGLSLLRMRIIAFLIGLFCIGTFFLLEKTLNPQSKGERTLQFAFLPFLFPFFFLIYNEMPSILLVLLMLLFVLKKRATMAGLCAFLAVSVKQTNIVWVLFGWLLLWIDHGPKDSLRTFFSKSWAFIVAVTFFAIFVVINRGVAVSDRDMHPLFSFRCENVFFTLFAFFWTFLPLVFSRTSATIKAFRDKRCLLALLGSFVLFVFAFHVDHPYNQAHLKYYLHNKVLMHAMSGTFTKIAFFICAAYAAVTIWKTELREKRFRLFYVASIASLVPLWLIEIRYSLIPLVLFLLFRVEETETVERASWVYGLIVSLFILYRIEHKLFFL